MDRKDAEKELRARLIDAGAQFKRLIPSSEEVGRVGASTATLFG